jgi:hypothetical protein
MEAAFDFALLDSFSREKLQEKVTTSLHHFGLISAPPDIDLHGDRMSAAVQPRHRLDIRAGHAIYQK